MKKRGSFALLDSLVRNGTRHIFGYPGGAILPIYGRAGSYTHPAAPARPGARSGTGTPPAPAPTFG